MQPSRYAAFAAVERLEGQLTVAQGVVQKHASNPLFRQTEPWEPRIDNGYPSVVAPVAGGERPFQLWYGTCAFGCDRQLLLYANSTDGIAWTKPHLGIFDLDTADIPELKGLGTRNNVLVEAGGVGVFLDEHEADPSQRYKAIGPGCWTSPTLSRMGDHAFCGDIGGSSEHHDGGAGRVRSGGHACCRRQLLPASMDPASTASLTSTERRFVGQRAASADGLHWRHVANVSWPPPQKWDTQSNAFYDDALRRYVVTTRSIPILKASGGVPERTISVDVSPSSAWRFDTTRPPQVTLIGSRQHQPYAQVTWRWLDVYMGIVAVYDPNDVEQRVHSRLAWSREPLPPEGQTWQWVHGNLTSAADFIPLGSEDKGDFDSHIVFAAPPVSLANEERVYYMGGNGPHSGPRNTSFALAHLRRHGYASVAGSGVMRTAPMLVTAPTLTVSTDMCGDGGECGGDGDGAGGTGWLRIGVRPSKELPHPPDGLSIEHSTALRANATDAPMHFGGGCDFSSLIGTRVSFEVHMARARLYTIGFEPARAGHASNNRHSSGAKEHAAESSASEKNSCHPRHGGAPNKEGHGSHGGGHGREHLVVEESSTKRAQEM